MEANNGFEYRIVKVRSLRFTAGRAVDKAVRRAGAAGWEVINTTRLDGVVVTEVLTLRKPARVA